ncbi:UNVERIFIED_CONTAM: hypothetical protein GTU68_019001 [Idotea baltica]|nr:hypothetical protein [Idotea baltica]
MSISLITHKRITTTLAKAKALRIYVEPLITRSKTGTTHDFRVAFSYLQNKEAIKELFEVVGPKVGARPGGYTRIIKLVNRRSDNAEMAIIELVDFNEAMASASSASATETTTDAVAGTETAEAVADVETTTEELVAEAEEVATDVENAVEDTTAEATDEEKKDSDDA